MDKPDALNDVIFASTENGGKNLGRRRCDVKESWRV
jgi:hypothetical protein